MPTPRSCRFFLALLLALAAPALAVTLEQIPTPRPAGWSVDLTGTLSSETLAELNRLGDEVKARTGAELAVVVVGTIDGAPPREFATRLANSWGIGEAGKNNGLLVFAALDDRAAEIVLGDGIDDDARVRTSETIMREVMVPRFRDGDASGAILQGARACAERIFDVARAAPPSMAAAEPESSLPSMAPSPLVADPPAASVAEPRLESDGTPWAPLLIGLGALGSLLLVGAMMFRAPRCSRCKEKMTKLDEAADDAYLEKAEQVEERIGSVDHQIWLCPACGERTKHRHVAFFSRYKGCPKCSARTLESTSTTIEEATYTHGGRVQVDESCANCSYTNRHAYATAMLVRPREDDDDRSHSSSRSSISSHSSTSSNSSSSSSSSSTSSGSDFGGGHSSGGGASGRW
jgi:uncharacterized protein